MNSIHHSENAMKLEIINKTLGLDIHGFSGRAIIGDYAGTAFRLMDKMWQRIKSNNIKNKGLNIWVYEKNEEVFAGVELIDPQPYDSGLEHKNITLNKYAYYKHMGPYSLLAKVGHDRMTEISRLGFETDLPYIEIYGHWTMKLH